MNNFEELYPTSRLIDISSKHRFDITLVDFQQKINNDVIQLEAEWFNNINYFSREANKIGITFA